MTSSLRERIVKMNPRSQDIYAFSAPLLDGREIDLGQFKGQVLLIVNTASKCGFTPQYAGLEQLYLTYKDRRFSVLGFPCNQFGRQEPGSAEEIGAFCRDNHRVSFPLFAKIDVNGAHAHPLYRFLTEQGRGFLGLRRIAWNFTKFLVGRNGTVVHRFGPSKEPKSLAAAIEALL
jgi:glutathione peroxidase